MEVSSAKSQPVQAIQQTRRAEEVSKPKEPEAHKAPEAKPMPMPMLNTLGQSTGRVLNVTA